MERLKVLLRIKEHEFSNIKKEYENLKQKIIFIEKQINSLELRLNSIELCSSKSVLEYAQKNFFYHSLVKALQKLQIEKERAIRDLEIKREALMEKKKEIESIKKLAKRMEKEKERYEEIQLERFLNEVYNSRNYS